MKSTVATKEQSKPASAKKPKRIVIVDDHRGIWPMRNVPVDVTDHRGDVDLLEENVLDLNECAIGDARLDFAL